MNKEVISDKHGIAIIILFIIGTSSIEATGLSAEKDLWLAIIIGILMALPIIISYIRIHYLFPGKDLFDILEICYGKYIGKAIVILFTWFVFDGIALVIRNYAQFVVTVSMIKTPLLIVIIFTMFLCVWIVKSGIEVIGRWSRFFLLLFISVMMISIVFLLPDMNINNIRPVLNNGMKPVLKGAYETLNFPFTQTVLFMMVLSKFKRKDSPVRIYMKGVLTGGVLVFIMSITNILVLGLNKISIVYFPTYATLTRIEIGSMIGRLEIISGTLLTIGVLIKTSIYLLAACKGVSKIFRYSDYRFIVTPIALLAINLSYFQFETITEYYEYTATWYHYGFPFHVILPIIIWITAEVKKKRMTNSLNKISEE